MPHTLQDYLMTATHKARAFDFYASGNMSATRPNGKTTPFGGLMSDPFETPVNRTGYMALAGLRYNFANDERTKLGFEFNHGSQYWFNFAQASDDITSGTVIPGDSGKSATLPGIKEREWTLPSSEVR